MLEHTYSTVYWPRSLVRAKDITYGLLELIDCNFSKLLHELLPRIGKIASRIKKEGKNYTHYEWHLVAIDKETGEKYDTTEEIVDKI